MAFFFLSFYIWYIWMGTRFPLNPGNLISRALQMLSRGQPQALSPCASRWNKGREFSRAFSSLPGCWPLWPCASNAPFFPGGSRADCLKPTRCTQKSYWETKPTHPVNENLQYPRVNYFSKFKGSFQETSVILNHTGKSLYNFPCG